MMTAYQTPKSINLSLLLQQTLTVSGDNKTITGIEDTLDACQKGQLFIAKQGQRFNALSQIDTLIKAKPSAILCQVDNVLLNDIVKQKLKNQQITLVIVNDIQPACVYALKQFYSSSLSQLQLLGVTGTDGKSSVAMMFAMMQPEDTGVIGTLGYGKLNNLKFTGMTTPSIVALYKMLASMQQSGCTKVVMEVSSHAIDQQRIAGLHFEVVAITNLGRDHLDYHGNLDNYHQCKLRFLTSHQVAHTVVNSDDENLKNIAKQNNALAISTHQLAKFAIKSVAYTEQGIVIQFGDNLPVVALNLYGQFNLYNVLTVIAMYQQLGEPLANIVARLSKLHAVEGRLEKIADANGRHIFVDFAHTANGLKNALSALKQHFKNNITIVFGCGGDRDKGKRPEMASVAEQLADCLIMTSDNPRSENPHAIIADMQTGLKQAEKAQVVLDRFEAIKAGLQLCQQGEVLLIAGKGHETTQTDSQGSHAFHDASVIKGLQRGGL